MAATQTNNGPIRDSYFELIHQFPLRRIRNDEELDAAVSVVDRLVDKDSLDEGEEEYLHVLGDLIHQYESSVNPISSASDGDVLRHLMEANALKQKNLAEQTGIPESVISEIISGKRKLNRNQVAIISNKFSISPSVFFSYS